jgi:polysaccharide export outer membrane protein
MRTLSVLVPVAVAIGCSGAPRRNDDVRALVGENHDRVVPRLDLRVEAVATELPPQDTGYRVGVGDVLDVRVPGHPEFSNFRTGRDEPGADRPGGVTVKEDGRIYLPNLGGVQAAGRSVLEVQADLVERLRAFLERPFVSVDVLRYQSQKFFVLGAVQLPGVFPADGETTLLEGIARAGGARPGADLEGAYVVRGRTLLPISLADILLRGDTSRNVVMRHGDLVFLPDAVQWRVFVVGEVTKPGAVPLPQTGLSLAAALAEAGGLDRTNASRREIRVYRGSWQAPRVFTLTEEDVLVAGHEVQLKPGDRIHVAPRGLATWSRTLTLMFPFLDSAVTGLAAVAALQD